MPSAGRASAVQPSGCNDTLFMMRQARMAYFNGETAVPAGQDHQTLLNSSQL